MFTRAFARTIPDNLRAPHMKMWGFEAKRARKFTRTSPRTLPWNFITMLSAPLRKGQKQAAQKQRKRAERCKNGQESEKIAPKRKCKNDRDGFCCSFLALFPWPHIGGHLDLPRFGCLNHAVVIGTQERICICNEKYSADIPADLSLLLNLNLLAARLCICNWK